MQGAEWSEGWDEVMEHNGIEVDEQDMDVDRQTSQQEGCQTRPENTTSLEAELDDDIKHPTYTPDPESTQPDREAWSWSLNLSWGFWSQEMKMMK